MLSLWRDVQSRTTTRLHTRVSSYTTYGLDCHFEIMIKGNLVMVGSCLEFRSLSQSLGCSLSMKALLDKGIPCVVDQEGLHYHILITLPAKGAQANSNFVDAAELALVVYVVPNMLQGRQV